jgi:hypothetical protein
MISSAPSSSTTLTFSHFGFRAHGPALENKIAETNDADLKRVFDSYKIFITTAEAISFDIHNPESSKSAVIDLTKALNSYREIAIPILEARDNSGQENLRSSILEEFFQLLLFPLTSEVREKHSGAVTLGKANSYVGLTFTPRSFGSLFENPAPSVHTKDQDFVLGCIVEIASSIKVKKNEKVGSKAASRAEVVVPVVAIECKTYIERNMLDSCAGTAKRLKAAMPYCLYLVAAEYMKMDDAYPELTDIDEVYILTKKSNSERLRQRALVLHPICEDLILEIFQQVATHLNKIWWSPEDALERGRVINRP